MLSRTFRSLSSLALVAAAVLALSIPARAQHSATALFSVSGQDLTITLTNTGATATQQTDVLTALLFDVTGNVTLTPVSAALGSGSNLVINGVNQPVTPFGGEWQYTDTGSPTTIFSASGGNQHQGISSTGLGIFGSGNFGVPSEPLDGSSYGLVNGEKVVGGKATDGLKDNIYIDNSAVFHLTIPTGVTLTSSDFSHLAFVYGTAVGEGCIGDCGGGFVPEPAYYQLASLLGLGGLGLLRLRRRKTTDA